MMPNLALHSVLGEQQYRENGVVDPFDGSMDYTNVWESMNGYWGGGISSSGGRAVGAGGGNTAIYDQSQSRRRGAFSANQYARLRIDGNFSYATLTNGNNCWAACVRFGPTPGGPAQRTSFYAAYVSNTGETDPRVCWCGILKCVNGAVTILWTQQRYWGKGDWIECRVVGDRLWALQNGTVIGTATDTDLTSGAPGMALMVSMYATDWEGGSLDAYTENLPLLPVVRRMPRTRPVQPQGAPRINMTHPLAKYVVAAYVGNYGFIDPAGRVKPASLPIVATQAGIGRYAFDGANDSFGGLAEPQALSMFMVFRKENAAQYGPYLSLGWSSIDCQSNGETFDFYRNNQGEQMRVGADGSGGGSTTQGRKIVSILFTNDGQGGFAGNCRAWVNGAQRTPYTVQGGGIAWSSNASLSFGAAAGWEGTGLLGIAFKENLSIVPGAVELLHRDYWALFAPSRRRVMVAGVEPPPKPLVATRERRAATTQPPTPRIHGRNPITAGLTDVFIPVGGKMVSAHGHVMNGVGVPYVADGKRWIADEVPALSSTQIGQLYRDNCVFSWLVEFKIDALSSIAQIAYRNKDASAYGSVTLQIETSGQISVDTSWNSYMFRSAVGMIQAGVTNRLVLTYDPLNNLSRVILNGTNLWYDTWNRAWGGVGDGGGLRGKVFYGGTAPKISLFAEWGRALALAEAIALTATPKDPWQILEAGDWELSFAELSDLQLRYARPARDVSAGTWQASTGTVLFDMVDEPTADDADYIYSYSASGSELGLQPLVDPQSSSSHTLRVRARTDRAASSILISVYQGATLIAQWTQALTGSWVTYEFNLTGPQIDAITDYTALSVKVEAL